MTLTELDNVCLHCLHILPGELLISWVLRLRVGLIGRFVGFIGSASVSYLQAGPADWCPTWPNLENASTKSGGQSLACWAKALRRPCGPVSRNARHGEPRRIHHSCGPHAGGAAVPNDHRQEQSDTNWPIAGPRHLCGLCQRSVRHSRCRTHAADCCHCQQDSQAFFWQQRRCGQVLHATRQDDLKRYR